MRIPLFNTVYLRSLARHRPVRLPAPGEHLLWRQPIPARDIRNNRTRNKRFFHNLGVEIQRTGVADQSP